MRLSGKVALVTGAGQGIGAAVATRLVDDGASVVAVDIAHERARETATRLAAAGGRALAVAADVTERGDAGRMVAEAVRAFGRLDILVNNAGTLTRASFLDMSEAQWDREIAVTLKGQFLCAQAAAREMIRAGRGGRVINLASIVSVVALPNQAAYVAAKGGVRMLTKAMALEWAPHGITVNAIGPGVTETPMNLDARSDPDRRAWLLSMIPLQRFGVPEEIAGVAAFLASEEAGMITGTVVFSDGGWLIR